MALSLHSFASLRSPNPNPNPTPLLHGIRGTEPLPRLSNSPFLHLEPRRRALCSSQAPHRVVVSARRRFSRIVSFAASNEESIIYVDSRSLKTLQWRLTKDKTQIKSEVSQEEWAQTLEQFKAEALKMKAKSAEAYEIYSKKAVEMLLETSEKLKIQTDKAQKDLGVILKEVGEEGQQYLSMAAEKSPDSVKDILETFKSLGDLKSMSQVRDYHVGVPFGSFLAVGGFLNFMLTGSIPAIRFGVVLGTALLALSIASLRSWRSGRASPLLLKGQAAIAIIIFLRQLVIFFQDWSFSTFFMFLIRLFDSLLDSPMRVAHYPDAKEFAFSFL
ncbi:Protein FATTY ACID EXPORT 3, chloroplastic [Ananas comosus]|uniref:Protein FATTY ACID EXPORT 3, chloroplastic n=1 Tax=Ananas comosus TaxID=4615 RepID=A0A199VXF2_ANACO|nr:Protein FATTY ACID EXPORT 3, chloroplastic [Ananas comosus]